jgi:cell filamentation protein
MGRRRSPHERAPYLCKKGAVIFAHPNDIRKAVDYALERGQNKAFMAEKPGEVMGYLAFGHPFLDGNGRTIMLIHAELAPRGHWDRLGRDG